MPWNSQGQRMLLITAVILLMYLKIWLPFNPLLFQLAPLSQMHPLKTQQMSMAMLLLSIVPKLSKQVSQIRLRRHPHMTCLKMAKLMQQRTAQAVKQPFRLSILEFGHNWLGSGEEQSGSKMLETAQMYFSPFCQQCLHHFLSLCLFFILPVLSARNCTSADFRLWMQQHQLADISLLSLIIVYLWTCIVLTVFMPSAAA